MRCVYPRPLSGIGTIIHRGRVADRGRIGKIPQAQVPEHSGTWALFKFPLPPLPRHPEAGRLDDQPAIPLTAGLTIQATVRYLRGRVESQTRYIDREWRVDQAQ